MQDNDEDQRPAGDDQGQEKAVKNGKKKGKKAAVAKSGGEAQTTGKRKRLEAEEEEEVPSTSTPSKDAGEAMLRKDKKNKNMGKRIEPAALWVAKAKAMLKKVRRGKWMDREYYEG